MLSHGELVDFITNRSVGPQRSSFWDHLKDVEFQMGEHLEGLGVPYSRYSMPMRHILRDSREEFSARRADITGLRELLGGRPVDSEAFRIFKDPTLQERGYGSFILPREEFVRQTDRDALLRKIAYTASNVQLTTTGYEWAGTMMTTAAMERTADQLLNIDHLRTAKRLVFDVETAGLEADKGIWQLSARLVQGDEELKSVNLIFDNKMMDIGSYGVNPDGSPMTFKQFYGRLRKGQIDWIGPDNFADEMMRFLKLADEADYLVAHNAQFDVDMINHALRGKMHSSSDFAELARSFMGKADSGKLVDTRTLARFTSSIFDGKRIEIADSLRKIDKITPVSIENIMLQTNFLEQLAQDIDKRTGVQGAGWKEIRAKINIGMHHGDVDTWFQDRLTQMQFDVLSGFRPNLLANVELADELLRERISEGASITPHTKLDAFIGRTGEKILDPVTGKPLKMTPMQFMAEQLRSFSYTQDPAITDIQLRQGGIFRNWAEPLLRDSGAIRPDISLLETDFLNVQQRAIDMKLPFAGLSPVERLVSTVLGTTETPGLSPQMTKSRRLMGDLTGSAFVDMVQTAKIHGRNVAVPMELIMAAETSSMLGEQASERGGRIISSRFHQALSEGGVEGVQLARWSAFEYGAGGGRDVALVADIFQSPKDVERFIGFMEGLPTEELARYGLTRDYLPEYRHALLNYGQKYGVQIGILGEEVAQRPYEILRQLGIDLDSKSGKMYTSVYGLPTEPGKVGTTASFFGDLAQDTGRVMDETQATRAGQVRMADESLDPNIGRAIRFGRGDPERANRVYGWLTRNMPKMPRRLGYAGAALVGYYFFRKGREQQIYDETTQQQEYEDEGFYEDYRRDMGQQVPPSYRRQQDNPLATAGLMQNLDMNKTRHHQMGARKYDHLFGG